MEPLSRGATSGRFPSRNLEIVKVYSWVQKLKNVNPDISQEGYLWILWAFQEENGCQSLTFEFATIIIEFPSPGQILDSGLARQEIPGEVLQPG